MDHWLLGDDLKDYLEPWRFGRLNIVEQILLAQRLPASRPPSPATCATSPTSSRPTSRTSTAASTRRCRPARWKPKAACATPSQELRDEGGRIKGRQQVRHSAGTNRLRRRPPPPMAAPPDRRRRRRTGCSG